MHRQFAVLALAPLAAAACVPENAELGAPTILEVVGTPAPAGETPRGIYMVIPAELESAPEPADELTSKYAAKWTLYMNRNGGQYTVGNNDSRNNVSSVPENASAIPAWNVSQQGWQFVMDCVRDQFAAFDMAITDLDPGNAPHIESVVAGVPGNVQLPNGVGGVSPFRSDCGTIQNAIVFTFAEVYGNDYQTICEVVAQEVAHAFGLDHEYLASDPMTYLPSQAPKTFQDVAAPCGEDQERTCACGQQTQNSVQMLAQRIGIAADAVAPQLSIGAPADGALVAPGFTVDASASDDKALMRVELHIDGALVDEKTSAPFTFTTDSGLSEGPHTVELRAHDSKNVTTETISVTVDADAPGGNGTNSSGQSPSDVVGGCSATASGSGSLPLLMLGLAMLLIGWQRRT